jgi:thiol-disulfide isomerase/thioredoxin
MSASRFVFFGLVALLALGLFAACGDDEPTNQGAGEPEHDFAFIPYQGFDADSDDDEVFFSDVFAEGKPVVLNFWAGQCPPCRAEMPHFQQLADEYENEFILLGIDVGVFTGLGSEADALQLLDELNISYPAGRAVEAQPLFDYNATGMPTTIFFNADGEVVERRIGLILEDEMREKLGLIISSIDVPSEERRAAMP